MFAIVEIGGKQYKVQEGDIVFVEKIEAAVGETVKFDKVLAVSNDSGFVAGAPLVAGASVTASVARQGKDKKIYILKYKSKKTEKSRIGHRQPYTKIQITSITA